MFWKGKVSLFTQITSFIKGNELTLTESVPTLPFLNTSHGCSIGVASLDDTDQIARLLNKWFESNTKTEMRVTGLWVRESFLESSAIWIVAKDRLGTVRGCVSSFRCKAPYPNSLSGCSIMYPWGLVDWYCVEPLWRSKGVGTDLLETLDYITYKVGRKAHIFLKEGIPLSLPHIPIYSNFLYCRKAGNTNIKNMHEYTGLTVSLYNAVERSSGLPLIRVTGTQIESQIQEWENALDSELPPCWVFIDGSSKIDIKRGWKQDTLVSMYAFRWVAGKWLGSMPQI
jgi:GNAT superfamily N-acetyltransferase